MVRSFLLSASFAVAAYVVAPRLGTFVRLNAILAPIQRDPVILIVLFAAAFITGYNLLLRR